jgi:uncharacterized protein (DUF111 family)
VTALVLDPVGGIAGDMLIAALLHLGAPRAALNEGLRRLGLAEAALEVHEVEVAGIRALHVTVRAPPEPHQHRSWREIRDRIAKACLPPRAETLAQSAFARLAAAEGRVHGVAEEEV